MVPAVAGHLVAGLLDGAHELGTVLGDLANDKKSRLELPLREPVEKPLRRRR